MTTKHGKIAYLLLFSCLIIWLALIVSAFFSSGKWTTTIVFANQTLLTLFEGAAIFSSILSLFLGLNFLGISLKPRKPIRDPKKGLFSTKTLSFTREKEIPVSNKPWEKSEDYKIGNSLGIETFPTEQKHVTARVASMDTTAYQNDSSRNKDSMKSFYLFGETEFNHCAHEFGYLGAAWKNKPIPDECFGCPRVIECVAPTNKK